MMMIMINQFIIIVAIIIICIIVTIIRNNITRSLNILGLNKIDDGYCLLYNISGLLYKILNFNLKMTFFKKNPKYYIINNNHHLFCLIQECLSFW